MVQLIVTMMNWLTATAEAAAGDNSSHSDQRELEAVREAHSDCHV